MEQEFFKHFKNVKHIRIYPGMKPYNVLYYHPLGLMNLQPLDESGQPVEEVIGIDLKRLNIIQICIERKFRSRRDTYQLLGENNYLQEMYYSAVYKAPFTST